MIKIQQTAMSTKNQKTIKMLLTNGCVSVKLYVQKIFLNRKDFSAI